MNQSPLDGTGKLIGCFGSVIGLLIVLVGVLLVGYRFYELAVMQHTTGIAVRYEKGMHGGGPHVRYTVDEQDYIADAYAYRDSAFDSGVSNGDTVGVYYWRDSPEVSKVDLFVELWFGRLMPLGVGCGFLLIGQILYWTSSWRPSAA